MKNDEGNTGVKNDDESAGVDSSDKRTGVNLESVSMVEAEKTDKMELIEEAIA